MRTFATAALLMIVSGTTLGADTWVQLPLAKSFPDWIKTAWQGPPLATRFVKASGKPYLGKPDMPADIRTEMRAAWAPGGLMFAIRCFEQEPAKRPARNTPAQRDRRGIVLDDDCVELFIDPNHDREKAFGIAVNMKGAVLDALYFAGDMVRGKWNSGIRPMVKLNPDSWDVSFMVPFSALGTNLSAGDVIGLAVMRSRKNGKHSNRTLWPGRKTFFSWWQRRSIPDPFFFADTLLMPVDNEPGIVSLSRGKLSSRVANAENAWRGYAVNRAGKPRRVKVEILQVKAGAQTLLTETKFTLQPAATLPVRLVYGKHCRNLVFRASIGKATVYQSGTSRTFELPPRIYARKGDFFPELVTRVDKPLARFGFMTYPQHMKGPEGANQYALAMGMAYSLEETIRTMAREKDLPFMTVRWETDYNNLARRAPMLRKYGNKVVFFPYVKNIVRRQPGGLAKCPYMVNVSKGRNGKSSWSYRSLPCDRMVDDFLLAMEQGIREYSDLIWAVILPDEQDASFRKALKCAFSTPENRRLYPLAGKIDADIRARFGAGKYGLVKSDTPESDIPFCKIATQRFLNDFAAKFATRVRARLRELKPELLLIGDDPQGQVFPADYRARWKSVDIITHQTHDKAMPQDLGTSVISKFVTDTANKKEFWPCVHFEGTSSIWTLDESREILSRAFRNGATGATIFNLCWAGAMGQFENIGAPEKWAYLNQVVRFYGQGFRAKLPATAKLGAFYSGYSSMADYSRGVGAVYKYLGPASGAYFKFIDDFSIERGERDPGEYKVIFVAFARYESPKVVQTLLQAVREKGITLVITDPRAFSSDLAGRPLQERDTLLGGITFGKQRKSEKVRAGPGAGAPLSALRNLNVIRARPLGNTGDAKVLLRYRDNQPACVQRVLGKGRVIWFGFNPFLPITGLTLDPDMPTGFDYGDEPIPDPLLVSTDPSADRFFKILLQYLKVPLGEKIWTLKLPKPEKRYQWPKDLCLSGNSLLWSLDRPRLVMNAGMPGKYRFTLAPTEKEDADTEGWIAFAHGRLTDRVRARRDFKPHQACILTWKQAGAFALEIDLGGTARVNTVRLFASGAIPACRLSVSTDNKTWSRAGISAAKNRTDGGVAKITLKAGALCRILRVDFAARPNGRDFIIAEMDVWGNPEYE